MPSVIPQDLPAENAVLGSLLIKRDSVESVMEILSPEYFHRPMNAHMFAAIKDLYDHGEPIDAVTVGGRLVEHGFTNPGDWPNMALLMAETPAFDVVSTIHYAKLIERAKAARDVMRYFQDGLLNITDGGDPFQIANNTTTSLLGIGSREVVQLAQTIPELLASEDAISQTLIPQLLMVDHRVIITAKSGSGKSTLLKYVGYCAAQGIHPFTRQDMTPIRVLAIDTENPTESILQTMEPLRSTLQNRSLCFDDERFRVLRRPGGMNIRTHRDRSELQREIAMHQPDLLIAGPVYKLTRKEGNESWEGAAEGFIDVIDDLRTKHHFAVLLEAHVSKHSEDFTPQGSVILSQWAEVGLGLHREDSDPNRTKVERFREDRVQGLGWPSELIRVPGWLFEARF